MDVPTVYRVVGETDEQHRARLHGFEAGWRHQNYVTAYGPTSETHAPPWFDAVADTWYEAYRDGKDEFEAAYEDAEAYGHDWRQVEPVDHDWH